MWKEKNEITFSPSLSFCSPALNPKNLSFFFFLNCYSYNTYQRSKIQRLNLSGG